MPPQLSRPDSLFSEHQYLADNAARFHNYSQPCIGRSEVKQAALIGLWKAAKRFPGRGSFVAYANRAIQNAICNEYRSAFLIGQDSYRQGVRSLPVEYAGEIAAPSNTRDHAEIVDKLRRLHGRHRVMAEMVLSGAKVEDVGRLLGYANKSSASRIFNEVLARVSK